MKETADVAVIGAGIIGASITYQLALRGASVVTVDKAIGPAEGSTGASSSICRCRYSHPELTELARYGQQAFARWPDYTGLRQTRSGLRRTGALWMTGDEAQRVMSEAEQLIGLGVEAEALSAQDVEEIFPALSTCMAPFDMSGEIEHECWSGELFLYEPGAGYADPVGANQDLVDAARAAGAEVRFRSAVTGVVESGSRVTGIELAGGDVVEAGLVVNAAGPWCNRVNEMAGVDLGWTITPTRIQTVYRAWPPDLGPIPFVADGATGIYMRPDSSGRQILLGSVVPEDEEEVVEDPDDFKRVPDPGFTELKLAALHHRVPGLEPRGHVSGIAGLYTINREDVHPILGESGREGFWVANGFSGHGFKLAPAVGAMMARSITGVALETDPDVQMGFFSADRRPLDVAVKSVLA